MPHIHIRMHIHLHNNTNILIRIMTIIIIIPPLCIYIYINISEVGGINSPANPNREVVFRVCVCVACMRDATRDQGLSRHVNVLLLLLLRLLLLLLLADRCNGNEKSSGISIKVIFQVVIYKKRTFFFGKTNGFFDHGRG